MQFTRKPENLELNKIPQFRDRKQKDNCVIEKTLENNMQKKREMWSYAITNQNEIKEETYKF